MKRAFNLTAKIAAAFALTVTLGTSVSPILANENVDDETAEVSEEGYYRRLCTTEVFELPGSSARQSAESIASSAVAGVSTILWTLF